MQTAKTRLYIVLGVIGLITILNSIYIIDQRQLALVLQFGEAVDYRTKPGLNFKMPFIQDVLFFDRRIQDLSLDTSEVISSDQKTMRVDAFAKYRITDALKFYQAVKDDRALKTRLSSILDSNLRQVLGGVQFKVLLTDKRKDVMKHIQTLVNQDATSLGIAVLDVRIKRADLPEKSREAVFLRMRTEREKEAREIRAQGEEEGQIIVATADKEREIILAEAGKKAKIAKGTGDAEAIKTFADSFGRDPEFYDFYRSLEAYRKTLGKDSTKVILSPDSEFLKHFNRG
jgi:membrane protease subunit HflC